MSLAMPVADRTPSFEPATPRCCVASPTGRLRQEGLSKSVRNMGVALHLTPLIGFLIFGPLAVIAPVVLWLIQKDDSPFVDDHGREVINFGISFVLLHFLLGITIIGVIAFPVIWIVGLVSVIRGATAASNGEYFRYPITIRIIQ